MHEVEKFFANFQILGPLGCQGWVVIPQNVKKSQNHCTLLRSIKVPFLQRIKTEVKKSFVTGDAERMKNHKRKYVQ